MKSIALALACSACTSALSNRPGDQLHYIYSKPYDQSFLEGYSILKHVGHQGPYSNRQSYGIGRDPPESCAVDQVIMIKRHGERFPEAHIGAHFRQSLDKLYGAQAAAATKFSDALEFLNAWQYFIPDERVIGLESPSGPYSGLLDAYRHGAEYGVRYGHLWDASAANLTIPMFSSGYERILMTARHFGQGFFGWNYTDVVAMNIIPEYAYLGADSLTPACLNDDDLDVCHSLDNHMPQFEVAAARLNGQLAGLALNYTDVYNLMQMTAYELNVRGHSPWVDVFSLDEWVAFGYTQDLQFYYCSGPGDKNMRAVGSVYANATLALLRDGPDKAGKTIFNFAHDSNITPILAALGINVPSEPLPLDHIPFPNGYSLGNIMPMGGHLTMERLACNATAVTAAGTYVRLVLNEAVVPYDGCQDGPGFSCALANYTQRVSDSLPDFLSTCGYDESYPQYLDFWWNYNTTKEYALDIQDSIPAQEGLVTFEGTKAD